MLIIYNIMNKYLTKKKIAGLLAGILICFFVAQAARAEDSKLSSGGNAAMNGLNTTAGPTGAGLQTDTAQTDISVIIGKIVGAGLAFIGVVFMILIIYGGILWMTARGNEQQVEKAKELIYAAVIGLVIVLSAYAITYYVGGVLGQTSSEAPAIPAE